jgi:DNA-directed RNA polymerase subunit K/omega
LPRKEGKLRKKKEKTRKKIETLVETRGIIKWRDFILMPRFMKNNIKMANKKTPTNTLTRDLSDLAAPTGNIYESVVILSKRANQIAIAEKKELTRKLEDFKNDRDTMEEVFENREQIEISKYYERQPKPSLVAIEEFQEGEVSYRMAKQDEE